METNFTTSYTEIVQKIAQIDPIKYGKTRNYIIGDVTYLSPYISRGVISTKQVLDQVLSRGFKFSEIESFVKELCWRDYFQRVGQVRNLNEALRYEQAPVLNRGIPHGIVAANTGIEGIDRSISGLYKVGYMHNHCRMYTASLVCNLAKSHWHLPAKWMYYHLLDGDWASNACSWQWVAGANSAKKYVANQENLNKYTATQQVGTFLDVAYEKLASIEIPTELSEVQNFTLETNLPKNIDLKVDINLPTFIYNYSNLDPCWRSSEKGNRILLLEPDFFEAYPVSEKCVNFMLDLSRNIDEIQVYIGSFDSLKTEYKLTNFYFKEHPMNKGYEGKGDARDWIVDSVEGYFPSFFAYWKLVEKQLLLKYS
jgi:deoxyribodipyrimidine photo-lyase